MSWGTPLALEPTIVNYWNQNEKKSDASLLVTLLAVVEVIVDIGKELSIFPTG